MTTLVLFAAAVLALGCGSDELASPCDGACSRTDGGLENGDASAEADGDAIPEVDVAEEYVLCDGSPSLRLGFQVLGGGKVALGVPLLTQNGFFYLFVDGLCNFWVYGAKGAGDSLWWQATHTGVLSPDQATQLTAELDLTHWTDRHEVGGWCDAPTVLFWREGAVLVWTHMCGIPDPPNQSILDLRMTAQKWLEALWTQGTPVETPVRLVAITAAPSWDTPGQPTATLEMDLAAIALTAEQGNTLTQSDPALLVTDPSLVSALRKAREKVIAGAYHYHIYPEFLLPVRQNGIVYFVYFRDTIPLENADGLIRPPE